MTTTCGTVRRLIPALLMTVATMSAGGCATLAHRSSHAYPGRQAVESCDSKSDLCPWLVGDALLLIPGLVPGLIAFAVDFGTGAWHHDNYAPSSF